MDLTDEDLEFVVMVTRELRGYLNCLENIKLVYIELLPYVSMHVQ